MGRRGNVRQEDRKRGLRGMLNGKMGERETGRQGEGSTGNAEWQSVLNKSTILHGLAPQTEPSVQTWRLAQLGEAICKPNQQSPPPHRRKLGARGSARPAVSISQQINSDFKTLPQ